MALKDFECCDARARESLATRFGRDMSRSVTDDACWRIRADFEEMPDLTVTPRQAARFWAIDEQVAAAALQHLQERGILRQTPTRFPAQFVMERDASV
jgi:hypothetical protein